jgi:hypothetical protein
MNKGLSDLVDNWDKWSIEIKSGQKDSIDYIRTV